MSLKGEKRERYESTSVQLKSLKLRMATLKSYVSFIHQPAVFFQKP
jgi:hypothetical protein